MSFANMSEAQSARHSSIWRRSLLQRVLLAPLDIGAFVVASSLEHFEDDLVSASFSCLWIQRCQRTKLLR